MKHSASLVTAAPARAIQSLIGLACTLVGLQATAQIRPTEIDSKNQPLVYKTEDTPVWGLGIGAATGQRPYAGAGNKSSALPLLYFENRWVRVIGPNADVKGFRWGLTSSSFLSLDARIRYDDHGFEADDSPMLSGMDKRKGSVWGGATAAWDGNIARLSAEWLGDLSSNSKGQKFQLQLERRFWFGKVSLSPRVQAQWLDDKYVNYYYGVRAQEAQSGRAQYTGKSATTFELGMRMDYVFNPTQSIFLDVSNTKLPNAITQSPIVDRSNLSRAVVGYLYRF